MSFKKLGLISTLFWGLFVSSSNSTVEDLQIVAYNPRLPHIALQGAPERIERPLGLAVPLHRAEAIAASKYPTHFIGRKGFRPELVRDVREGYAAVGKKFLFEPAPFLNEDVDELIGFLNQSLDPQTQTLREEILFQKQRGVTPMKMVSYYLRYAHIGSVPTDAEKDLFANVIYPHIFKGLLGDRSLRTEMAPFLEVSEAGDNDPESAVVTKGASTSFIDWHEKDRLEEAFERQFPVNVLNFRPGSGKFGLTFLVRQCLNDVYLIGIPSKPLAAHGTKISKLGFAVHDMLHHHVDPRQDEVERSFIEAADKYLREGGRTEDFSKHYLPYIIGQYQRAMQGLHNLSDLFLARLLPHDKQAYDRAMVGFFYAVHEFPSFEAEYLSEGSLQNILSKMICGTRRTLHSDQAWESSEDPLTTSPLDGTSAFSDEEIKKHAFRIFSNDQSTLFNLRSLKGDYLWATFFKSDEERNKALVGLLEDVVLTKSPAFHAVTFKMKSGKRQRYSFPTLSHKWNNMEDSLALLKIAGISIQKPELPADRDEARKIAQTTLDGVSGELNKCLDSFEHWGSYFLNQAYGVDESLQDDYFISYGEHKREVSKILTALRKKAQQEQKSFEFLL